MKKQMLAHLLGSWSATSDAQESCAKNMKKFLSIILLSICSMVFVGCGNGQATGNGSDSAGDGSIEQTTENQVSSEEKSGNNEAEQKTDSKEGIVVWFSRVGNTEFPDDVDATSSASLINDGGQIKGNAGVLAEWISEETGYDTFEIVTKNSYPVDYGETTEVAKEEQNADARPELTAQIEDFEVYKTVYLVFPNWWGDMPQAQVDIFGDGMKEFYKSGSRDCQHINYWLADNCFGDYYTRGGLTLAERELVTFCYIYAQGGCEPQLEGHTAANFRMGNDKGVLRSENTVAAWAKKELG